MPRVASASERVAQSLRDDITAERLRIGDRLPTRTEMRDRYGIAAMTAAKVIKMLTEEGVAQSVAGQGVFVVAQPTVVAPEEGHPSTMLEARLRGIEARLAQLERRHDLTITEKSISEPEGGCGHPELDT